MGAQIQASTIEQSLLGEALILGLHSNRFITNKGIGLLANFLPELSGRQGTALIAGLVTGSSGVGPSLGLVAGFGDAHYQIEQIADKYKIYANTVNHTKPILPQLPRHVRNNIKPVLRHIGHTLLTGEAPPERF